MSDPALSAAFTVRAARPADFAAIADLTVGVYVAEGYAGPHYVDTLADVPGRAASTELIVAEHGGRIVGAVALASHGTPYAELAGPGEAVFRMLVVDPDWRGAGVATALVQECLRRARESGHRAMVICTEPHMHAAHRLYQRLGFRRVPERDWSPTPGIDLLAYRRPL